MVTVWSANPPSSDVPAAQYQVDDSADGPGVAGITGESSRVRSAATRGAGPVGRVLAGVEGDRPGDGRRQHQDDRDPGGQAARVTAATRRSPTVATAVRRRGVRFVVAVAPGHGCTLRAHP